MQAGRLDRRVQLLREQETGRTLSGQRVTSWVPFVVVWAERIDPKGQEVIAAQQVVAKQSCIYRVRHRDDVFPELRLQDQRDERVYDIKAVLESRARRESLDLVCEARAEEP